jgi:hypothetical protein
MFELIHMTKVPIINGVFSRVPDLDSSPLQRKKGGLKFIKDVL